MRKNDDVWATFKFCKNESGWFTCHMSPLACHGVTTQLYLNGSRKFYRLTYPQARSWLVNTRIDPLRHFGIQYAWPPRWSARRLGEGKNLKLYPDKILINPLDDLITNELIPACRKVANIWNWRKSFWRAVVSGTTRCPDARIIEAEGWSAIARYASHIASHIEFLFK